jgi:transposase-like protein
VVIEPYVNGVSTRYVDDLVAALGVESGISKSEVSASAPAWTRWFFRTRRLDHIEFPYIDLDATYLHVRNAASQVTSLAVAIATASPLPVNVRCSASTSATPRTRCSGAASSRACANAASAA